MAQFDTGLGWSAIDRYLMLNPGRIAIWEDFGPSTLLLPYTPTEADLKNNGMVCFERIEGGDVTRSYIQYYGVKTTPAMVTVCAVGRVLYFISNTPDTIVVDISYYTKSGDPWLYPWVERRLQNTHGSMYYFQTQTLPSTYHIDASIPVFNTATDMWNNIQIVSDTAYKLNTGYAIACIPVWNNLDGETVSAPALISTEPDYIKLSKDGGTETPATVFGFKWQNTTFYMALLTGYSANVATAYANTVDLTAAFPGPTTISVVAEAIARAANIQVTTTPDPYGDDAQPGGGVGNPDEDEEIDFSTPPTVGSYVGFFRMWNPTETELRQLASWMWSSQNDLEFLKKLFSAPIESILGLSMVPVQPAGIGGYTIVLGGVNTGISAFTVTNRYVTVDCGSIAVEERWGAYLDYSPFTKMSIFLPYIGFRDISTDDVMGKTVALQYNVDVLSGVCVAELKCGGSVLYSWQGNCAQQMPITAADWSAAFSSALGLAGTAAAAIVTKGGTLPLGGTVASSAVNALSMKPSMERGGSISGAAGAMAGQVPYLVRERPEQAVPGRQNHFIGYPSFTTVTLGSIAGYTEVESIHLEGIPATAAELSELESILKEGFIL